MSGGVDSSMCAHILHRQGYDVTGLYMHNWNHQEETQDEYEPRPIRPHSHTCTSDRDWADVQAVCQQIGIPSHRLDFSRQYWNQVFEAMLQEYERGRTPNPDIACNREIKFGELIKCPATLSGWDYLATGHYARVEQDPVTGRARLMRSPDSNKDQSYYLSELSEPILRHVIFPLAQYNKSTVKGMAIETGVQQLKDAAMKKESMGVCFVGQRRRFGEFLQEYLKAEPGPVKVNGLDGREIGQHKGLFQYTIGQASGIAFGHQKWVVLRMDLPSNTLIVVEGTQNERLFSPGLIAESWHWIAGTPPKNLLQSVEETDRPGAEKDFPFTAQIRHRQQPQPCRIELVGDPTDGTSHGTLPQQYVVRFKDLQRAIAPGQHIVLYDRDECLGGAVIYSSLPSPSGICP
ncbi:MAG: tRNA(5-methylaminomethyl-2-thiouridylate)-methyl transferase [Benniella sp.]|nr:MAG: tRNA(5-methylaminomethyl-2-thiouridylate)-methyl transferase [Benniella sp.]